MSIYGERRVCVFCKQETNGRRHGSRGFIHEHQTRQPGGPAALGIEIGASDVFI
jgi:hypothetical protein